MAAFGNIELKIDPFFIKTRVELCCQIDCRFNDFKTFKTSGCKLKEIAIASDGSCRDFEKKEEGVKV